MVAKRSGRDEQTAEVVKALIGRSGRTQASIAREIVRLGGQATAQAVGKWVRDGKISRANMELLRQIAAVPEAVEPAPQAQRWTKEGSDEDAGLMLAINRLQNSVHSIRLALGAMAAAMALRRPDEGADVRDVFRDAVPEDYQDMGLGKHFLKQLEDAIATARARASSRRGATR